MKKYTVGTNALGYPQLKNFADLPFKDFKVVKFIDICRVFHHIIFRLFHADNAFLANFYYDFGLNKADIYHFFNAVTPLKKPWVVTYESLLPGYKIFRDSGFKLLASDNCRKIIAISERAIALEKYALGPYPEFRDAILGKTIKLAPSQRLYVDSVSQKPYGPEMIFTMVGEKFFLKGGREALIAFERLIKEGLQVKLNIISNLETDTGSSMLVSKKERQEALLKINKYPERIKYYGYLPNDQVIEILKQSHVGLLPSYLETYGYSALEAMSCGCPVIATNLASIAEFINEDCGWLIDIRQVEREGTRFSDIGTPQKVRELSGKLSEDIYLAVKKICDNPDTVKNKGERAILNVKNNHDPVNAAKILEGVYLQAIG